MKRLKKIILIITLAALLSAAALGIWLLEGPLNASRIKILSLIPVPIGIVGERPVFVNSFLEAKELAGQNKSDIEAYNAALSAIRYKYLAQELNLSPVFDRVSAGHSFLEEISAYKTALKIYYAKNKDLNRDNFLLAESIISRLKNGENFESLSDQYNQDEFSKTFGGNSGNISINDFLPEIKSDINKLSYGDYKILASRFGLHIVQAVSASKSTIETKQIFLPSTGYDAWLESKLNDIKIKSIIKP